MCLCYIRCIKKDYDTTVAMVFLFIFFACAFSSTGLSAAPFKKCIRESIKQFHITVYIISMAQLILGLIMLILSCKKDRWHTIEKILSFPLLLLPILLIFAGIYLFLNELSDINNYGSSYVKLLDVPILDKDSKTLTFWNVAGTYMCWVGFIIFEFVVFIYSISTIIYVFSGVSNSTELLDYYKREEKNNINNGNNCNNVQIITITERQNIN